MKVQVIYSSLSGRTRKVAEAIYADLPAEEKELLDLKDGEPTLDGDVILFGYWVDKGGPNAAMKELLPKVEGKAVGVFCTLGFYADSEHARKSLLAGVELLREKNTVLGGYVCNGALSESIISRFRQAGTSGPHSATPENEIRWAVMKDHPTEAELALAAERFKERVEIYRAFREKGLTFKSVL